MTALIKTRDAFSDALHQQPYNIIDLTFNEFCVQGLLVTFNKF